MKNAKAKSLTVLLFAVVIFLANLPAFGQAESSPEATGAAAGGASADFSYSGAFASSPDGGSGGGQTGTRVIHSGTGAINSKPFTPYVPRGTSNVTVSRATHGFVDTSSSLKSAYGVGTGTEPSLFGGTSSSRPKYVIHVGKPSTPLQLGPSHAITGPTVSQPSYGPNAIALQPSGKSAYKPKEPAKGIR